MGFTVYSKYAAGIGSILYSVVFAFSMFGILGFDISGVLAGLSLIVLGVIIFAETWIEEKLRERFAGLSLDNLSDTFTVVTIICLALSIISLIMGAALFFFGIVDLVPQLKGVLGLLFLLDAIIVGVEMMP